MCSGSGLSVNKATGRPTKCVDISCEECLRHDERNICGQKLLRQWAESEYIEKPVISKKDRAFLEYLKEENKYIARDENGGLFIYNAEPYRDGKLWTLGYSIGDWFHLNRRFNLDFPMIKLEDDEPCLIEYLKKLEVVDSYE